MQLLGRSELEYSYSEMQEAFKQCHLPFVYWKTETGTSANSEDPDETPHNRICDISSGRSVLNSKV